MDALPGHIGDMDVKDCLTALEIVLGTKQEHSDIYLFDREKIGVVGMFIIYNNYNVFIFIYN